MKNEKGRKFINDMTYYFDLSIEDNNRIKKDSIDNNNNIDKSSGLIELNKKKIKKELNTDIKNKANTIKEHNSAKKNNQISSRRSSDPSISNSDELNRKNKAFTKEVGIYEQLLNKENNYIDKETSYKSIQNLDSKNRNHLKHMSVLVTKNLGNDFNIYNKLEEKYISNKEKIFYCVLVYIMIIIVTILVKKLGTVRIYNINN